MSQRGDGVFLDANVLFSAAHVPDSPLRRLWKLAGAQLITSEFALEEARRNLLIHNPDAISVLDQLSARLTIIAAAPAGDGLAPGIALPEKDRPILSAAVAASCTHLLTGDKTHFGALYGRKVEGALVLTPAQYLRRRSGRR